MATYDWKYLICGYGEPNWEHFADFCGTWETQPFSNRDFDCCVVAENIAEHHGLNAPATICLEDMGGDRFEVGASWIGRHAVVWDGNRKRFLDPYVGRSGIKGYKHLPQRSYRRAAFMIIAIQQGE